MTSQRRTALTRVTLGVFSAVSTARAQGRGAQPPRYKPAAGAKELRAVLFNWTSSMGMLRGQDQHELVATLEYQGKGTIQVEGLPCTLTKYRISNNYETGKISSQIRY
jgi:hypothetical protein